MLFAAFLFTIPTLRAQSGDVSCIPNVVVDLEGECETLVTPSMVLSDSGSVALDQLQVNIQYGQETQSMIWHSSHDDTLLYEVVCATGDCADFTGCSGAITVEPYKPVAICDTLVEVLLNYETPFVGLKPEDIAGDSYIPCQDVAPLYWWWEYPDGTIGMEKNIFVKDFRVEEVGVEMKFYVEVVNHLNGPTDTCSVVIEPQMIDSLECGPSQVEVECEQEPAVDEAVFLNAPPYHHVESLPVTQIGDDCQKRELHQTRIYNTMMYDAPEDAVWDTCTQEVTYLNADNTIQKIYIPGEDLTDDDNRWNNKIRTFFSCQDAEVTRNDSLASYDPVSNTAIFERIHRVKDLCRYDGVSEPIRLSRDVDCNGIEGDQDYYLLYSLGDQVAYLDPTDDFNDEEPAANANACDNLTGYYSVLDDYNGYFEYRQLHTVHDFADVRFEDTDLVANECDNTLSLELETLVRAQELDIAYEDSAQLTVQLDYYGDGIIDAVESPEIPASAADVAFYGIPPGSHAVYAELNVGANPVITVRDTLQVNAQEGSNYGQLDCAALTNVFLTDAPGTGTNNFLPYEALSNAAAFCSAESYTLEYTSSAGTPMSDGVYFDEPVPNEVTITVEATDEVGAVLSECSIDVTLSQSEVEVTVPDTTFMPGDTLCLPVIAKGFETLTAFQFPVSFNSNHLHFEEVRNTNPLLPSFTPGENFGDIIEEDSTQNIRISHVTPAPDFQPFNIPDSVVLFEACFTPIVGTTPCTSVGFEDNGGFFQPEFINQELDLVPYVLDPCQAQIASQLVDTLCTGESLMVNNQLYDQNHHQGTELIPGATCDSTLLVDLQFLPNDTTAIEVEIALGEAFQVGNETFSEPGDYEVLLTNQYGCDSLVNLRLDLLTATEATASTLPSDELSLQQLLEDAPAKYPNNELRLFDALGRQVYYAQPYDGRPLSAAALPSGVYYYVFRPEASKPAVQRGAAVIAR